MSYKVQFLGLVCFYRQGGGRLAMLPDGRNPGQGIEPHYASVAVDPEAIIDMTGWDADARESGTFTLPACTVEIDGLEMSGTLDTRLHEGRLPHLGRIDPNFHIDPASAETIATIPIRRGTLEAYLVPAGTAVMSQLDVPHDGEVRITVTPRDGSAQRVIRLQPGTEVAVQNTAAGGYGAAGEHDDHFKIYEKLSSRPVNLRAPGDTPADLQETPSSHIVFRQCQMNSLTAGCSNVGCCP